MDTSHNKQFTSGISGTNFTIKQLYNDTLKIFQKYGEKPPLHWRIIRKDVRKVAQKEVMNVFNRSSVRLNVFEHQKPCGCDKKTYFLRYLPNQICAPYEPVLKHSNGFVNIEIHDDYTVKKVQFSSRVFSEKFLENLCQRLTGQRIPAIPSGNIFIADIHLPDGRTLKLFSKVLDSKMSEAIQLADIFFGYYSLDKSKFDQTKVRLHKI